MPDAVTASGDVDDDQYPEIAQTIDAIEAYARQLAGDDATFTRSRPTTGPILVLDIVPTNPAARHISVIGEQFLIVTVGRNGGRFELSYSDDDVRLARNVIEATVAGRISERVAFGRSRVTVVFGDGQTDSETGYDGCVSLLVPQPGWTRWGRLVNYAAYSSRGNDR